MTSLLRQYSEILVASIFAADVGDENRQDQLLELLDGLWLAMTPEDRAETARINANIATGVLSLSDLVARGEQEDPVSRSSYVSSVDFSRYSLRGYKESDLSPNDVEWPAVLIDVGHSRAFPTRECLAAYA